MMNELQFTGLDPEKALIVKEAYDNLSQNAKDIIAIIHLHHGEIQDIVGISKTGKISKQAKKHFKAYLRKTWKTRTEVQEVCEELAEFVKNF